jgi:phospholipase D
MRFIIIFILLQYNASALNRVCFSPNDGICSCEKNVIEMLDLSTETVDLGIYALNNKNITNAIVSAAKRGVKIRAVYDRSQSILSSPFLDQLKDAGVECYYNHVHKIEHNKFIIVDNQIVMNGSFNFTETAEHKNSENCTIHNNINVVKAFSDRFDYLFDLYKKKYIMSRDKKEKEAINGL